MTGIPTNIRAVMPNEFLAPAKKVCGLKFGESGYISPTAIVVVSNLVCALNMDAACFPTNVENVYEDATVLVTRTDQGWSLDLSKTNHKWHPEPYCEFESWDYVSKVNYERD